MTNTPNRPPLWEVMLSASEEARMGPPGSDYAAKIRAVRDWLVPEEAPCPDMAIEALLRDERQRLRALLTAEAGRALEDGESGMTQQHHQ